MDAVTNLAATILIVDDEPSNRLLLEGVLHLHGYLTLVAANGASALAAVARQAPDLILLDIVMPGMDGYAVARLLKADSRTSGIPIIMLTAHTERQACKAALDAGAEEFLAKPIDTAELCLRVRNLLRLKAYSDLLLHRGENLDLQVLKRNADLSRFRAAMDATTDSIFLINRTGMRFIEVNDAACRMFGYTREEFLLGGPALLSSVTLPELENAYDAIIAGGRSDLLIDIQFRRKDGSRFHAEVSRNAHRSGNGWIIVAVLRDVTERMRAAGELRESDRRYSDMLANVKLLSLMVDKAGKITYCNDFLLQTTRLRREEVIGREVTDVLTRDRLIREGDSGEGDGGESGDSGGSLGAAPDNPATSAQNESDIQTRSGKYRRIRWSNTVLRSSNGEASGTASIGEDITEQKLAETRIRRLNRTYAVLSGINTLIVRTRNRDELFREACRIAVELGRFRLAWIGVPAGDLKSIVSVASAGDDGAHLALTRHIAYAAAPDMRGLAAKAMASKQFVVCNDIGADTKILAYPEEALARGFRSAIALPLIVEGTSIGALHLYTGDIDFFDEQEIRLLVELAGDISFALEHIEKSDKLEYLAYYDELTGLANSGLFRERVGQFVSSMARDGKRLAVVMFDIERFRTISDTFGRLAGDDLLKQVAERTRCAINDSNWLARIGGDHFAVVLPDAMEAVGLSRRLMVAYRAIFDAPFIVAGNELRIAAKIGIAMFPGDGANTESLIRNAEAALKNAKRSGERLMFYTQQMTEKVAEKLSMENKLRRALENEEFVLHYQPKVSLDDRRITGVEALIRWNDPESGLVSPAEFIPLLEETGLILEVGQWAMMRSVLDHAHWVELGLRAPRVAVNVSPIQLRQRDFVETVKQAIAFGAAKPGIDLEITESLLMDGVESNIAKLTELRQMGLTIYIDDFGTGYSSLGYLARLPVQWLKIDRSFVITMLQDPNTMSLVSTIISMAHSLRLKVVAEGVDKEEQAQMLKLLRCEEMQGYLFSKPVTRDEITLLLEDGHGNDEDGAPVVRYARLTSTGGKYGSIGLR